MSQDALLHLTEPQLKKLAFRVKYPDLPSRRAEFYLLQRGYLTTPVSSEARTAATRRGDELRNHPLKAELVKAFIGAGQPPAWKPLGPSDVGGRTRSLVFDPTDPNQLWAASIAGGVWKRDLRHGGWTTPSGSLANLPVSSLAIVRSPKILYAGTGEGLGAGDGIRGAGVYYSKDDGKNWTQIVATRGPDFQVINRLAVSLDGKTLLVATTTGLFRSVGSPDNPETRIAWSRELDVPIADVHFHPTNPLAAIAGGLSNGTVYYSADGGASWQPAKGFENPSGTRVEVTYAKKAPSRVAYASVNSSPSTIWRSEDGGWSFGKMKARDGNGDPVNYLGTQGDYDNTIWAGDPDDDRLVVVGGIELWRSTDGGNELEQITKWDDYRSAHADHHVIVGHPGFGKDNRAVFVGNDGGVYSARDIRAVQMPPGEPPQPPVPPPADGWLPFNEGLAVTQFYSVAGNPKSQILVGGAQDNGTLSRWLEDKDHPTAWSLLLPGDGGYAAADPTDPELFYGESYFLDVYRMAIREREPSVEPISGAYYDETVKDWFWRPLPFSIPDAREQQANFIAPIAVDPNASAVLYAGGMFLWRTSNATERYSPDCIASGPRWGAVKPSTGSPISAVTVAKSEPGGPTVIWVGHNNGELYVTHNGQDTFPWWRKVNGRGMPADRMCTRIAVDPKNSNRVFAAFGGYAVDNLWLTTDGGRKWKNVGTELSPAPVYSVVFHPEHTDQVYIGTEVGASMRSGDDQPWAALFNGLPECPVKELTWMGHVLVAATHGRGMFMLDLTRQK